MHSNTWLGQTYNCAADKDPNFYNLQKGMTNSSKWTKCKIEVWLSAEIASNKFKHPFHTIWSKLFYYKLQNAQIHILALCTVECDEHDNQLPSLSGVHGLKEFHCSAHLVGSFYGKIYTLKQC